MLFREEEIQILYKTVKWEHFSLFWYRTPPLEEVHTAFSIATAIQQCWMVAHNIYEISLVSKFVSSWKNIVSLRRRYDTSNSKVLFKIKPQKIRNKTPNFQNLTSICLKEKSNYITKSKLDFYYTIQPTHTQKKENFYPRLRSSEINPPGSYTSITRQDHSMQTWALKSL